MESKLKLNNELFETYPNISNIKTSKQKQLKISKRKISLLNFYSISYLPPWEIWKPNGLSPNGKPERLKPSLSHYLNNKK